MPEPQEYQKTAALLRAIAEILYGSRHLKSSITVEDLHNRLTNEDSLAVDSSLKRMEQSGLISLDLRGSRIGLLGHGRTNFERGVIAEIVLGRDYIVKRFSKAIVHIILEESLDRPSASGAGFFSADYPDSIITAAHVLADRKVERIEDKDGVPISTKITSIRLGANNLDLAIAKCKMPDDVEPLRVEWDRMAVSPLANLIVFGYPQIGFHLPRLYQSSAELHQIAPEYVSDRNSLIISSSTHPGCSGGPVVDHRGFAVGVIEQENTLQLKSGLRVYFSATPTYYLEELL
jgi:hypothetical protein